MTVKCDGACGGPGGSLGVFVRTKAVCPACRKELEECVMEAVGGVIAAFVEEKGWDLTQMQDEGEKGPIGTPVLVLPPSGKVH